jgi:hypothetical protein
VEKKEAKKGVSDDLTFFFGARWYVSFQELLRRVGLFLFFCMVYI